MLSELSVGKKRFPLAELVQRYKPFLEQE